MSIITKVVRLYMFSISHFLEVREMAFHIILLYGETLDINLAVPETIIIIINSNILPKKSKTFSGHSCVIDKYYAMLVGNNGDILVG